MLIGRDGSSTNDKQSPRPLLRAGLKYSIRVCEVFSETDRSVTRPLFVRQNRLPLRSSVAKLYLRDDARAGQQMSGSTFGIGIAATAATATEGASALLCRPCFRTLASVPPRDPVLDPRRSTSSAFHLGPRPCSRFCGKVRPHSRSEKRYCSCAARSGASFAAPRVREYRG